MSTKRKGLFSTPSGKRVNSAFKSPFRSPIVNALVSSNSSSNTESLNISKTLPTTSGSSTPVNTTPKSSLKRINNRKFSSHSFKSPVVNKQITSNIVNKSEASPLSNKANFNASRNILPIPKLYLSPEEELKDLLEQEKKLDEEIDNLEAKGYSIDELNTHIDKLHKYNDLKDTAQMLMGTLAEIEEDSIKAMHIKYGIDNLEN